MTKIKCPHCGKEIDLDTLGKTKKSRKRRVAAIVAVIVVVVAVVAAGLWVYDDMKREEEARAYTAALSSNEPAVLQSFLDMYAMAPQAHRDTVKAHIKRLRLADAAWQDAARKGSKDALEKFVRFYPGNVHVIEAKLRIDSIDFTNAQSAGTEEAYLTYIETHPDGLYIDDARSKYEQIETAKVGEEDKRGVTTLFQIFFNALGTGDEAALTSVVAPVLVNFLHKENATKTDVLNYMAKLHEPDDITSMSFTINDDYDIDKQEAEAGLYEYSVTFSVDQHIERADTAAGTFASYKVNARVSVNNKIDELNMRKMKR